MSIKKIMILALCLSSGFSMNVIADTSGTAQLETTPPAAEGPMTTEQTPAIIAKTYNNSNNNPQGNSVPPKTGAMSPTNGNPANPPIGSSGAPIPSSAPVPASPTNPNANLPQ